MLACVLDPISCVPEWITGIWNGIGFLWSIWPYLAGSLFLGMVLGALLGWKGLLIGLTGGLALFFVTRKPVEPAWETGERPVTGKPKVRVNRTAKRTPDLKPPTSLTGS